MGINKFIETLKNFGDTISSAADGVFDEVNKTFDGLDTRRPGHLQAHPRAGKGNREKAGGEGQ